MNDNYQKMLGGITNSGWYVETPLGHCHIDRQWLENDVVALMSDNTSADEHVISDLATDIIILLAEKRGVTLVATIFPGIRMY